MSDISAGIAQAFTLFIIGLVVAVAAITSLAWWGLPKLWAWLKPLIHGLTS